MEEGREMPNNQLRQPFFIPLCFFFFSFLSCLAWLGLEEGVCTMCMYGM